MGVWLTKNYGLIIVVTLLVLTIIIAIYLKGRKDGGGGFWCGVLGICDGSENGPSNGSANPGSADVPDAGTVQANPNVVALSNRLSQYLNETVFLDTTFRCEAYVDALGLSDVNFIALGDYFKNTNNNTLRQAISATWYGCDNFLGTDPKNRMLARLDELNIP